MSWTPFTPVSTSPNFSATTVDVGMQFWKTKDVDAGDGSTQFYYILDETAPIVLSETQFITLTDTADVLP